MQATQALATQWSTKVPEISGPIAVFSAPQTIA
jgi:hypothetical protein